MAQSPRLRGLLLRVGLLIGSLAVIFLSGELCLRVVEAWRPDPGRNPSGSKDSWIIPDSNLGYRLRPSTRLHNADGLVGPPVPRKSERFRVLVLGDSLPYGRNNLVDRTGETMAGDASRQPSEFLNAAVPGYTNYQELEYLKKYGVGFQPDLVGVVFVLNDLHRFLHAPRFEGEKLVGDSFWHRDSAVQTGHSTDRNLVYSIARRSRLLVWTRQNLRVLASAAGWLREGGYSFEHNPDFSNAWRDEKWRQIEAQLREMAELGVKAGFKVFLVAVPYGEQLRKDYLQKEASYVLMPQRRLKEICGRLGIPMLDLYGALDRDRHMQSDRIHLTPEGAKVAGDHIARFLKERDLVPRRQ